MPSAPGILTTNYDYSQLFIGKNLYNSATYTNSTGSTVTIQMGRLIGRVLASDKVLPQVATAVDGSEQPIGIAMETVTVADGESVTLFYCYAGDINQNAVIFNTGESLATIVRTVSTGGGTLGDLITRNTTLNLYPTVQLAAYDNQ